MIKKSFLIFLLFLAFVLIGIIYTIIISSSDISDIPETNFQGPPAGEVPSFDGPTSPPPSSNISE